MGRAGSGQRRVRPGIAVAGGLGRWGRPMERALTGQTAAIDVESGGLETGPSGVPIGRDRARDMVVNCVLPFLHASASLRPRRAPNGLLLAGLLPIPPAPGERAHPGDDAPALPGSNGWGGPMEGGLHRPPTAGAASPAPAHVFSQGVTGFGWYRRRFWFVGHDQFHWPEAASRPLES